MTRRHQLLAGAALAALGGARRGVAQAATRWPRVGVLSFGTAPDGGPDGWRRGR